MHFLKNVSMNRPSVVPEGDPPPSCSHPPQRRPPPNRGSGSTGSFIHSPVLHYTEWTSIRTSIRKRKGEGKGKEGKEGEGKGKG